MYNSNYFQPYYYSQNYQPTNQLNQNLYQQQTQQQNNFQNTNVNWVQVNGIEGAKSHIVQPNTTIWLMDNNEPVFYVKSADNLGTTTLKSYKFTEISDKIDSKTFSAQRDIDLSMYVKKSEIDDLIANKISQIAENELKVKGDKK